MIEILIPSSDGEAAGSLHREGSNLSAASVRLELSPICNHDDDDCNHLDNHNRIMMMMIAITMHNNHNRRSIRSSTGRMEAACRKPPGRGRKLGMVIPCLSA